MKPWSIIAGIVVALMALIYVVVRSPDPPANSPDASALAKPAATPVTESTTADLSARFLFRELRQCVYASRELSTAKQLADGNRIAAAEEVLSQCDQAELGRRYFEATKQAAKNGDVDAQLCYLQGDFFSPEGTQIFTDAEIAEYKKVAPAYVDAAFKRGDWRVVDLLNTRHFHPGGGPVPLLDLVGERYTRYKLTKLLRLGASGSYAEGLDDVLKGMKHATLNPAAAMPPEAIKEGDAWAQQTYTNYFSGVPSLTEAPVVCRPERGRP